MPHLNLLYPFRPRAEFPGVTPALRSACAAVQPFRVSLGEFRSFRHASGRCTLWLAPQPIDELLRLQAALQAAFPDCDDLSRFPAGFTPHLSVGQFATVADCERRRAGWQQTWRPLEFPVTEVAVLARDGERPFGIVTRIPLGDAGAAPLER
jgi:2'-5' RNA ligase